MSHSGCDRPECTQDTDCDESQACIGYRCQNPCMGGCGMHAECHVEVHHPVCRCRQGFIGNPLIRCSPHIETTPNPCEPNPCGLNTLCQVLNNRAVCSCLTDFLGDPQTGCQPECTINSDCSNDKACINMKCVNPCTLGTICGSNAECSCSYHTPSCACRPHFVGNAFIHCYPESKSSILLDRLYYSTVILSNHLAQLMIIKTISHLSHCSFKPL